MSKLQHVQPLEAPTTWSSRTLWHLLRSQLANQHRSGLIIINNVQCAARYSSSFQNLRFNELQSHKATNILHLNSRGPPRWRLEVKLLKWPAAQLVQQQKTASTLMIRFKNIDSSSESKSHLNSSCDVLRIQFPCASNPVTPSRILGRSWKT